MLDLRQGWIAYPHSIPRRLRRWLSDRGSLTRRLQARCTQFLVAPQFTAHARPHADEVALLGMRPGARAYVREVLLVCDGIPVVFAHSVLPLAGLRGGWNGIGRLGTRSLGEALFSDPRIVRQTLAYRRLRAGHPLYRAAAACQPMQAGAVWARRSVFCLDSHPLLVTEVFLPTIDTP